MDIRSVDLNLLPVLDALLRHRSVTLAAHELDMSQSALSAALARLRTLLGDTLFVRSGRGLLPTARAEQLASPVASLLSQLRDQVLSAGGFSPATSQRRFTLSMTDVGSYVLWPRIVQAVRAAAPGVTLRLRTLGRPRLAEALENGEVDLAVGAFPGLPGALFQRRLYERGYVGLVRAGHPLTAGPLTLARFANAEQVRVRGTSDIQDRIDRQLATLGLQRRVVQELPSYLMLPPLLEAGDWLAVVPGALADALARHGHFTTLQPPLELPVSIIHLHWHRRAHEDPGTVWLRDTIVAHCSDSEPATASRPPGPA